MELLAGAFTIEPGFSHTGLLRLHSGEATRVVGGTTTLDGLVSIIGAQIQGPGTLVTTGTVTVEGARLTGGAVWTNSGMVDVNSGQIVASDTAGALASLQFDNKSGAVLDLTGAAGTNPLPLGVLTNTGTLESGGTATTVLGMMVDDTGTILIGDGTAIM